MQQKLLLLLKRFLHFLLDIPRKAFWVALGIVLTVAITSVFAAWNTTKATGDMILASDWNDLVTYLGTFGTAATKNVGTAATNVIQLDANAKLPAVDGSQLTNISSVKPAYSTTCGSSQDGLIRYNTTTKIYEGCNGTTWKLIASIAPFTCGTDTVTDGGYTYNTVQIGTQCWLKQNIKKGSMLASAATMPTNNSTVEKWCYDNTSATCDSEGGLYTWDEAMGYSTTAGSQGICPTGWHIPTDAQQHTLDSYLATGTCDANRSNAWDCDPAGTKLKVGGTSGFEGILTGSRGTVSTFSNRGTDTGYWSSTQADASTAWYRYLHSSLTTVNRYPNTKASGFSIRCLMD
ncbi:MAG: FISUMP domain-containing protein [Candidatus Gracilibacteria bacterium]|nr:FISUMP domain-containing protein [Candidatus Gracilibacteria bacterium]